MRSSTALRTTSGIESTSDYGILFGGIRYETVDAAAQAASGDPATDGWDYWYEDTGAEPKSPGAVEADTIHSTT